MKKHILIACLLLGMSAMTMAQMGQYNQNKEAIAIGVKGGMNIPQMWYLGNEALSQLEQKMNFTPTGGLFVEIPIGSALAIAPEAMYVQRGTDVEYGHIPSGAQVHYSMNVSYADLRLPFEFRLPIKPYFQPYLVAGAEVGLRLFGQIHIQRTSPIDLNETIDVGDANMGLLHAGAFAGVGVRSRFNIGAMGMIVKLSASYHQGLLDTYSAMEKEGMAQPINVNAYHITGSRLPRGLEATLGIAIPLELRPDDACATFSNDRRWFKHNKRSHHGY
jgi:hypothetical protein